jgi:hypothetical protein
MQSNTSLLENLEIILAMKLMELTIRGKNANVGRERLLQI